MNHWKDFKIGKKYRINGWDTGKYVVCVGTNLNGWPILESETLKGVLCLANSYDMGEQLHYWHEYIAPREFWLHIENGDIREKAPPDAVYNYIHVREVRCGKI